MAVAKRRNLGGSDVAGEDRTRDADNFGGDDLTGAELWTPRALTRQDSMHHAVMCGHDRVKRHQRPGPVEAPRTLARGGSHGDVGQRTYGAHPVPSACDVHECTLKAFAGGKIDAVHSFPGGACGAGGAAGTPC